jgi:hypothetical protein
LIVRGLASAVTVRFIGDTSARDHVRYAGPGRDVRAVALVAGCAVAALVAHRADTATPADLAGSAGRPGCDHRSTTAARQFDTVHRRAVRYFEEQKAAIRERSRLDAERRRIAEENERYKQLLASMVVIETRPYYINWFGAASSRSQPQPSRSRPARA